MPAVLETLSSPYGTHPLVVRRRDGWKVLHELTRFDRKGFAFDKPTLEEFQALKAWYDGQKPALQELISKRGSSARR